MPMNRPTRREFLGAGMALPALGWATTDSPATRPAGAPAEVQFRLFGSTRLKVTTVGMGCMVTSDPSVITRALDLGINLFDTARGYQGGNNERMVGAALGTRRKNVLLCTKSHAATREAALADLDTSLKELGTDYVDVWHLHGKGSAAEISDELIEAQQVAKRQGKVRYAGVSTHHGFEEVFARALAQRGHFDVILTSYNFAMEEQLTPLIRQARQAGVAIVAMKVMAGGFRRPKPGDPVQDKLRRQGAMAAALKWVLRDDNVDSTIPSITDMEQLEEDFGTMAAPFGEADRLLLAEQLDHIRPLYCRSCGSCAGQCRQGLPVAEIIRHLSYGEGYGEFRLARESYRALPADVLRADCGSCPTCSVRCPHGVAVRQRVAQAQRWLA